MFFENYLLIFFLLISFFIFFLIYFISLVIVVKEYDVEKISSYECGFDPFSEVRIKFNVKFYLVSILFIIFDIEIIFLFPWALLLNNLGFLGLGVILFFLLILFIGFIYEWSNGALDWN